MIKLNQSFDIAYLRLIKRYVANFTRLNFRHKCLSFFSSIYLLIRLSSTLLIYSYFQNKKIRIVIHLEHLGDIAACLAIASDLKRRGTAEKLFWVTRKPYRQLPAMCPDVDHVISAFCTGSWSRISRFFSAPEILDLTFHNRECFFCRTYHKKINSNETVTLSNYYNHGSLLEAFCKNSKIVSYVKESHLEIGDKAKKKINSLGLQAPFIAIHTRSNESDRDWTDENWNAFVSAMNRLSVNVVEIGRHKSSLQNATNLLSLCEHNLNIEETATVISYASLFVGIDSGPAHLANALRIKGIIIIGRYRAFDTHMPYTGFYAKKENCIVVRAVAQPAASVKPTDVTTAALRLMRKEVIE